MLSETVGFVTNIQDSSVVPAAGGTNAELLSAPEALPKIVESLDTSKDQGDDGGEMVFEGEDTVIY